MRKLSAVVAGIAVAAVACTTSTPAGKGPGTSGDGVVFTPNLQLASALQPFDACDELLDYVKTKALEQVGPYGLPGEGGIGAGFPTAAIAEGAPSRDSSRAPSAPVTSTTTSGAVTPTTATPKSADEAAPADGTFSQTNVQEKGVDEPDIVKTDGKRLVALAGSRLEHVDVSGPTPTVTGALDLTSVLSGGSGTLLLSGNHVLVMSQGYGYPVPMREGVAIDESFAPTYDPGTVLSLVDIANPKAMKVLSTVRVDGQFVSARMVGGIARVVTSSHPAGFQFVYPAGSSQKSQDAALEANKKIIESSTIDDWLPTVHDTKGVADPEQEPPGKPIADCKNVSHPKEFSGFGTLAVLSVDLGADSVNPADAVAIMADGQTVYASQENLYVATPTYQPPPPTPQPGQPRKGPTTTIAPRPFTTSIHKFDIRERGPARYRASGQVDGNLLNQFSMSEHEGALRVATTSNTAGSPIGSASAVVVLTEADGELKQTGRVGDMGKGEQIKAVRFIGDVGYVVTFRQTDPLYTLDLSDTAHPRVVGELKILGYSAYLHPVSETLLIGIGQDATAQGRVTGTKVSLFDVSNLADPREIQKYTLSNSNSLAEQDHHAFLWWGPTNLAVIPVQAYGGFSEPSCPPGPVCASPIGGSFVGAIGLTITADGIVELGRIVNPGGYLPYPNPCPPGALCEVPACGPTEDCATGSGGSTGGGSTGGGSTGSGDTGVEGGGTVVCKPDAPCPDPKDPAPTTTTTRVPCPPDAPELCGPITPIAPPSPPVTVCPDDARCIPPYVEQGSPIERSLVIGNTVYTLSMNGLKASALDTLAPLFWIPFA